MADRDGVEMEEDIRNETQELSRDHRGEDSVSQTRQQLEGGTAARTAARTVEYWAEFECKGGTCRHTCCQGWGISLSMKEYFRLLGMDCSKELRRKLDGAFHLVENPTEERYAQITPDWRGDCPMHMENGYCQLQVECGAEALSRICRLYPRSPRNRFNCECACSNSCERTLELLRKRTNPMKIVPLETPVEMPETTGGRLPELIQRHYIEIRKLCIEEMQDRTRSLTERVLRLGGILEMVQTALDTENDEAITEAVEKCRTAPIETDLNAPQLSADFQRMINRELGLDSRSVGDEAEFAENLLNEHTFEEIFARFTQKIPDWEVFFEQIMVNHMFYESFPFSDRRENLNDEFLSLSIVYGYARFLAACSMWNQEGDEALIDACAAAFRLIDHSAFDWNGLVLYHRYQGKK